MTYELALAPTVESVGAGRRLVTRALTEWQLDDLDYTATLLTSEVLTNSILHARTPILLTIERTGADTVTVTVRDESTFVPRRRRHAHDATTGRGIELLDQLAQSWNVHADRDGKSVVFVVGAGIDPWAAYSGVDWADVEL